VRAELVSSDRTGTTGSSKHIKLDADGAVNAHLVHPSIELPYPDVLETKVYR
jgi:hypothetical protein